MTEHDEKLESLQGNTGNQFEIAKNILLAKQEAEEWVKANSRKADWVDKSEVRKFSLERRLKERIDFLNTYYRTRVCPCCGQKKEAHNKWVIKFDKGYTGKGKRTGKAVCRSCFHSFILPRGQVDYENLLVPVEIRWGVNEEKFKEVLADLKMSGREFGRRLRWGQSSVWSFSKNRLRVSQKLREQVESIIGEHEGLFYVEDTRYRLNYKVFLANLKAVGGTMKALCDRIGWDSSIIYATRDGRTTFNPTNANFIVSALRDMEADLQEKLLKMSPVSKKARDLLLLDVPEGDEEEFEEATYQERKIRKEGQEREALEQAKRQTADNPIIAYLHRRIKELSIEKS